MRTPVGNVFWGTDYEYDDVYIRKFDFQGQNYKKLFLASLFFLCGWILI